MEKDMVCGTCLHWARNGNGRGDCRFLSGTYKAFPLEFESKEVMPDINVTGIESYPVCAHDGAGFTYETLATFGCNNYLTMYGKSRLAGMRFVTNKEEANVNLEDVKGKTEAELKGEKTLKKVRVLTFDVVNSWGMVICSKSVDVEMLNTLVVAKKISAFDLTDKYLDVWFT